MMSLVFLLAGFALSLTFLRVKKYLSRSRGQ